MIDDLKLRNKNWEEANKLSEESESLSAQLVQTEQKKANKEDLANTNKQLEALKKDFNESYYVYETLPPDFFEFGNYTGNNIPSPPFSARVRTKSPIKLKAGTEIKFNKDPLIFSYGVLISDLNDVWRGIDYGWLTDESFVIEEDSLVRFNLRYTDNRSMTSSEFDSIVDAPFDILNSLSYKVERLEKSNLSNELDENKRIAINSISVEFGRVNGASYTFVRIPKFLNNGKQITPKVDLTSIDKSLAGTKNSALNYARINDSIFTVNAGLFNISTREPVGQTIINGVSLVDTPMVSDNGVPIHPDECYPLAINGKGDLTTYPRNVTTAEMLSDGIKYAITGWGRLVNNFVIDQQSITNEIVHGRKKYIRQSIGQFQNGDYCVCTVDMTRGPVTNEAGLYYEELAQIFIDKGVKFAYSLDGGGSAQTVLGKRQLNPLYEGSGGRRVPTVITFDIV